MAAMGISRRSGFPANVARTAAMEGGRRRTAGEGKGKEFVAINWRKEKVITGLGIQLILFGPVDPADEHKTPKLDEAMTRYHILSTILHSIGSIFS